MSLINKIKQKTYNLSKAEKESEQTELDDVTYDIYFNCAERRRSETQTPPRVVSKQRRNSIACIPTPQAAKQITFKPTLFDKLRKRVKAVKADKVSNN